MIRWLGTFSGGGGALHSELLCLNCTIFGENIGNKCLTNLLQISNALLGYQTRATQMRLESKVEAIFRTFPPQKKIRTRQIKELSEFHFQLEVKTQPGSLLG